MFPLLTSYITYFVLGHSYQLDQLATETQGQPKLSAFFPLKRSPFSCNYATNAIGQPLSKIEDQTPKLDAVVTNNSFEEGETRKDTEQCDVLSDIQLKVDSAVNKNSYGESQFLEEITHANVETDIPLNESLIKAKDEEIGCNDVKLCEPSTSEPGDNTSDSILAENELKFISPGQPSTSHSTYSTNKHNISESSNSRIVMSSSHSTLEDPNFVENYFKVNIKKKYWCLLYLYCNDSLLYNFEAYIS